jgi:hypothetical protein
LDLLCVAVSAADLVERARAQTDLNAFQQLTVKRAQTLRDFLLGHKAALIAAA